MSEHAATTPEKAEEELPREEQEAVPSPAPEEYVPSEAGETTEAVVSAAASPAASASVSPAPAMSREVSSSSEIAPLQETTPQDLSNFCETQACAHPTDIVALAEKTLDTLGNLW